MGEACDLTAVEARRMIGARKLSPLELLESCLTRIEKTNLPSTPSSPWTPTPRERRPRHRRCHPARRQSGPLAGLPIGVKDLQATAGLRTTWGSLLFKDHVPVEDELSVANVRKAGGVILAKTNTPSSAPAPTPPTACTGPPANPFNPEADVGRLLGRLGGGAGAGAGAAGDRIGLRRQPAYAGRLLRRGGLPAVALA
jgi:Asp-tRNA(Asn)/Glu-tRNA(Gln) amidotransferase A subunit family amidase